MKIDAQYKIAELERRIVELERRACNLENECEEHFGVSFYRTGIAPPIDMGSHWEKMWAEFNLIMKSAFGGRA